LPDKGNFTDVSSEPAYAIQMQDILDIELVETAPDHGSARFEVQRKHCQAFGLVHGGVYAVVAETLAARCMAEEGKSAVGSANYTSFLRPVTNGTVTAEARPIHSGTTTGVWEVEFRNDEKKTSALSRVTLAVLP
jgi:1,4-dihydroxy-2-naphthoyl-CoA hydrolase